MDVRTRFQSLDHIEVNSFTIEPVNSTEIGKSTDLVLTVEEYKEKFQTEGVLTCTSDTELAALNIVDSVEIVSSFNY